MNEMLKNAMQNPENLGKAYMMVKQTLINEYGEAFASLSEMEQAKAVGHVLAELLGI